MASLLLDHGAEVQALNNMSEEGGGGGPGETALHLAAGAGHSSIVELLLNRGASIEIRNRSSLLKVVPISYSKVW